jgi:hypothetical protein
MTRMGLTDVNEFYETAGGVRITEAKEFKGLWSAVELIDVTAQLAVFTISGKGFLFLLRWAFETEAAFLRFVETARELWKAYAPQVRALAPSAATGAGVGVWLPP